MTTGGYIQNYATNPDGPLGLERGPVLWAVAGSAVVWLASTFVAGWISDRIGRRTTYIIGWILQLVGVFPLFPLVNTGNVWLLFLGLAILTIGLGFTYGPQAALYSGAVPGVDPLLRRLDLLRDRRDHRRCVRAHDRDGARAGDRLDRVGRRATSRA